MKCPYCKNIGSKVVDSRLVDDGLSIRRRRLCFSCSERFTTYERYDGLPLMVIKRDKRREPFDRQKLASGIQKACNKRELLQESVDALIDNVERKVRDAAGAEIKSKDIGSMVVEELKNLDEVAYVRFVSVFKEFSTASSFVTEVEALKND